MAYVITQNCCKDASCVPVCPVDCIRPVGDSDSTQMLYIDPETCIDCGACLDECPVDAIVYDEDLPPEQERFKAINADYFVEHPLEPDAEQSWSRHSPVPAGSLRVAIVGAGPAGCYAAAELIDVDGVEVSVFERLPTPFGLIRAGVAPDHQRTKGIVRIFENIFANDRMRSYLNVEVGKDITHDELLAHHHAVIYAVGANHGRALGIPGEQLPGVHPAAELVGWYNGHPDRADNAVDLSSRRAVIIGNGNVALDVSRMLLTGPDALAATDIADHALVALADGGIEEVVIVARRGIRNAAFSVGEFLALGNLPGVDVVVESDDVTGEADVDFDSALKLEIAREYANRPTRSGHKRIIFRFGVTPVEVVGDSHAEGLRVRLADGGTEDIDSRLIVSAIGYSAPAVPGLPHDPSRGLVPNDQGRVTLSDNATVQGAYVTGWVKRGPRGVIGTNRACAAQTVAQLFADYDEGALVRDVSDAAGIDHLLAARDVSPLTWRQWRVIDTEERERGAEFSRPRIKLVSRADMLTVAGG
ncbi:FAD-dependent oxidoreductase [Mycolicibacterium moriokaense]|uniref:ferredoxin--NADP(+) reductase n=1 Tax=Mycolicibacterium moriokaense TaxID=39691 RepID=A0A318H9D1_9MYCO|nr:FAD-dependent oxidoreductase [Mycolicibacterium moriokaense]PXX03373.1 ferredoxin--NADP+ reductase [Mycolicibacterium moriokaense]